jgi:hypothetical protein
MWMVKKKLAFLVQKKSVHECVNESHKLDAIE